MGLVKTLIHVHTNYSYDSDIAPETLATFARREGFGCIVVTDHDTIDGARRLAAITDVNVVIGEEITTADGDLIGLFLQWCIEPGMSARDTALAIREQGGLVFVPHPFVRLGGCGLREALGSITDLIDAVEIANAQNCISGPDRQARRFAERLRSPAFVGSDSHSETSIAPSFQLMPAFDGPTEFLDALRTAQLHPGRHPLSYFVTAAYHTALQLLGLPLPARFGASRQPTPEAVTLPAAPGAGCHA